MVALASRYATFVKPPRVHIAVGRPAIDNDAIEYLLGAGTLTWSAAAATRTTVRVSEALNQIAAALPASAASPW